MRVQALLMSVLLAAVAGCSKGTAAATTATGSTGSSGSTTGSAALQLLQALQASGKLPTLGVSASLAGSDADGDGVRDDIDTFIAGLSDSAAQKRALTQMAAAVQAALTVNTADTNAVGGVTALINRGDSCLWEM